MPPGAIRRGCSVDDRVLTQPFTVLIDPNVAADGVTVADLKEQFEHNLRIAGARHGRESDDRTATRGAGALQGRAGAMQRRRSKSKRLPAKLLTEPVRYGKPGLQAHITYLAGMTSRGDQKIGRDALERYAELKKELDAVNAELSRVLGR